MSEYTRRALLAALALAGLAACSTSQAPAQEAPATNVPVPAVTSALGAPQSDTPAVQPALRVVGYTRPPTFTGTYPPPGTCHARPGGRPDPVCTPGSVGSTNVAVVCARTRPSFSDAHRPKSGTERAKTAAMLAYGIPAAKRSITEYDHLVMESIGGSNDETNVWAEVSNIPGAGFRNEKDAVEARVLAAVCPTTGPPRVTLEAAQRAMAADWTTALNVLGLAS